MYRYPRDRRSRLTGLPKLLGCFSWVQLFPFYQKAIAAFFVLVIKDASIHRTYLFTSGLRVGANTLGATGWFYLVNSLSLTDALIGTFSLARATATQSEVIL